MTALFSPQRRIVILGGGYAGLTVAQRLSKQKPDAQITLIDAKPAFEERIRLHQIAAGQTLDSFSYSAFLSPLGVDFIQAYITAIDPDSQNVSLEYATGTGGNIAYDYLVYALGSFMNVDQVSGVREFAHAFDSVEVAKKLYSTLRESPNAQVLVVGGGLTGIETACELAECLPDLRVTLATSEPFRASRTPGGFSEKTVQYLHEGLERRKVRLQTGKRIVQLKAGEAMMSDGTQMAFDACVWTSGFKPSPLAAKAGIRVNDHGQIEVDESLRSLSHPNIVAVGDAASASSESAGSCRMGSATALAMAPTGAKTILALLMNKTPPSFRFVYLFRNICLGREDGIIQFVDRRDIPREIVWTGTAAAKWKEFVCQTTLSMIGLTSSGTLPLLPPLRTLPQLMQGMRQYA
ncbi:NAD(P)/FAD-dependent oxidoreductase [Aquirhabdus parva]|uniref:FAD/NAD(P)-binding domain-containing protein n=1 Tax=Aquirhabdus parva TaxID=2283318 RepID=A0A345P9I2_9GAMM|nr:FAD-dependent oxidoreductase [Aquirhabdus parva]AXI03941.1 hypothetical protein HYN46_14500 [Aquirhabdus parva]